MERILPKIVNEAGELALHANHRVFSQGETPENYLVVTKGCVKVFARSAEGKEVVLYRVRTGEMCILTTACLLGHTNYPAEAVTETDTVARLIPAALFDRLLNESEPFRSFVFEGLSLRLSEVMMRFEQLVLASVHSRLASFLLQNSNEEGVVEVTHELLAVEIGSAREVVSRHLKTMEHEGLIQTRRGLIRILEPKTLATFS
ncbi:MAG: Crp/Fnr family transcriptional regulator [Xanthomonadales bacterium]|nr:Crp/Fnr family transcriptional regulator [Gammaproteobacteria bacterium]MBT8054082.1 Crp/Fnr family transcriptional regulator [Gammaproteobacteria bacterium]NND55728.1 Crp/Fnr family transcriptional regulator [Xanthomonadales bacterium]NNK51405.1 Crp/Fnr family transcriptional regulator [Xanthomonadales bacterium]